ncbi:MAG: hypothetical protein ACRDPS_25470 [Nocardioides sp.]|uniref:hypothetical protein n=1 Tax=Nocardioides sp. TaxID=35761 RepID=UPI003D6A9271
MSHPYGYSQPYPGPAGPAGPPTVPAERPRSLTYAVYGMWLGAVLSAVGVVLILVGYDVDGMRETMLTEFEGDPRLEDSGLDPESFIDAFIPVIQGALVVFGLVTLGLWIWMALVNGKGRNWARIVATVFGAFSIFSGLSSLANIPTAMSADTGAVMFLQSVVLGILQLVLAIAILVLLWVQPTNAYVNAVTAQRKAERSGYLPR